MVGVIKIMDLQKVPYMLCYISAPNPAAGHHPPTPPLETLGQVGILHSFLWDHSSFLLGAGAHKFLFVSSKSLLPQFWQLYGGVNGHLLQEGLCHTQVYCTQSPCPCNNPLLTYG